MSPQTFIARIGGICEASEQVYACKYLGNACSRRSSRCSTLPCTGTNIVLLCVQKGGLPGRRRQGACPTYPNSTDRASFTAGFSRNCCSTRSGTTSSVETTATASSGSPGAAGTSRRPSEKFAMLI
jgi:hypothetical protein